MEIEFDETAEIIAFDRLADRSAADTEIRMDLARALEMKPMAISPTCSPLKTARWRPPAFTAGVMKHVRRQAMIGRLTVGAFGCLGAVIALLQLPGLLPAFVGVDHTVTSALDGARTEISQAAASNTM